MTPEQYAARKKKLAEQEKLRQANPLKAKAGRKGRLARQTLDRSEMPAA